MRGNIMKRQTDRPTIDVIIPTYKPGKKTKQLLQRLAKQTYPIEKVIVINTEEQYWDEALSACYPGLEVHHIKKETFDHGGTRHMAVGFSHAELFLCMTDDAVPADPHLVGHLVGGFAERGPRGERPAMVYGRQLADKDCSLSERFARRFNYPKEGCVKTAADIPRLGIKTYFGSNVCCAYDRQIYEAQGGFIRHTIFNEDMIFAGNAVQAGYAVVYQAEARVIHSHDYGNIQQFRRDFDLAVSQADHPEIFSGLRSEGEGIRLVGRTAAYLIESGHPLQIPALVVKSGCRYMGYRMGKAYRRLPGWLVRWCTSSPGYWERYESTERRGRK